MSFFSFPGYLLAACSPYMGQASLNEFFKNQSNQSYDVSDFVEVKILNGTINSTIFEAWKLRICEFDDSGNNEDKDGCSAEIPLSAFTNKTKPWLIIDGNAVMSSPPVGIEIGKYINYKTGFDAVLLDNTNKIIDYVSIEGYSTQLSTYTGCTTNQLPFDWQFTASGASAKFIFRSPDGIGDWDYKTSASATPTEDDTNDSGGAVGKSEWYMDEASWNSTSNEVTEQSSNLNHGTAYNGLTTVTPAKLCNGGSFDGVNDYIEIPHNTSLQGTSTLTYSAWINPNSWSGSSINQVMAKSVHGGGSGRSQMGIFSEDGRLVGRAETVGNIRHEVFTKLPTPSNWTHVVLVFNGDSLNFYINGTAAPDADASHFSSKTFTTTTLVTNNDPLMISKRVGSNQYYFNGKIDEVLIFQPALQASFIQTMLTNYNSGFNWDGATRNCPGTLHHIEFIHDESALTCQPETIKVKACVNADCSSLATSATTVGLSPSGWVGGDSKTFSGSADYKLQHTTAESVLLSTTSVSPAASNPLVCKTSGGAVIDPCNITFNDSGFIFDVTTQTSCVTSSDIKISAVRKSPTTEQCTPFFENKDVALKMWAGYSRPNTGDEKATLNYSGTDYPLDTAATGTDIIMKFDNQGQSTFTLTYPDAGELNLNATYAGSAATSDDGLSMNGSKKYVTKPAKLYVYSDDANSSCVSADPTNADCNTAFRKTGENFNLKIRAACNNTDNTVTPNFQLSGLTLISNLIQPVDGNTANLNVSSFNIDTTDEGEHTISTQNVDEVGVFTFTATIPAAGYLGETVIGTTALNTSANIGRFTPDHFNTLVAHACSGGSTFSYSGQPITVTASARNQNDAITVNYRDKFAFGVTLSDSNALGTGNFTNNSISEESFTSEIEGSSVGAGIQTDLRYTFTDKETVPGTIKIKATDQTDTSITSNSTEGTTEIRSGRTRVENTFGSELVNMKVAAKVEYYTANGFVTNTADTCSKPDVSLTDIATDPIEVGTGAGQTCVWDDSKLTSNLAGSTDYACIADATQPQYTEPPTTGNFNLYLKAPGENNTGDIQVGLISPLWLKYDWDGDGSHDDDPTGIASFGLYRGDDRIIYWREVFD